MNSSSPQQHDPTRANGTSGLRRYDGILLRMTAILFVLYLSLSPTVMALGEMADNAEMAGNNHVPPDAPLRVVYFHSPTCTDCKRVKNVLPQIVEQWGHRIVLELHNTDDAAGFNELLQYGDHYGIKMIAPPMVFVGDKVLENANAIVKQLNAAIDDALERKIVTFYPGHTPATTAGDNTDMNQGQEQAQTQAVPNEILRLFESFGPGAVALAGLLDGINPCAFTTIVFFLSMLAYLKKTGRDMLLVGAGFTVGMFVAYFLIGLGLLGAVKAFSVHHGLSSGLVYLVASLAFVLAGWSILDAVRYLRTGDTKKATLGLPKKVKDKIHKIIRTGLTTRGLLIGSLSVGFLVSILESLCTGQVYLPIIMFIHNITRDSGTQAAAIGYLLLYNIMFIVPLLAVLAMAYFGVRSETLGNFLRKRLALAKFAMATLFAGLGLLVLLTS